METDQRIIPKISFKGAFTFMIILFVGVIFLPIPFRNIGLSEAVSYFLAAGISGSIGISLILTKIDAKPEDKPLFKKRILLAVIVGFAVSALMTFVFGGDVIG